MNVALLGVSGWPCTDWYWLLRVFDTHNRLQKQHFDYKYMCFDHDFLEMLTLKEESGMVFWFRVRTQCFPAQPKG